MPSRTISKTRFPASTTLNTTFGITSSTVKTPSESDPMEVQSASDLGKEPIELLPAFQDRLVEMLIRLGEFRDVLAPADRFSCPVHVRQFLPVGQGEFRE